MYSPSNYILTSHIALPNLIEIANKSVYGMHLGMLSKKYFRVQMDAKSRKLKNESKMKVRVNFFSTPVDAPESGNETTKNAFKLRLTIQISSRRCTSRSI